jgi:hypothetical protein
MGEYLEYIMSSKKLHSRSTVNESSNEWNRRFSEAKVQMVTRYTKKCLTSLSIRKTQIKTTLRFHGTPIRMAIIKKTNKHKYWWGYGGKGILIHCW